MNKLWDQLAYVITCVLLPGVWTAEAMLDVMVKERVTGGQGVPDAVGEARSTCPQLADADLSSLRLASTGSAPVSPELAEQHAHAARVPDRRPLRVHRVVDR